MFDLDSLRSLLAYKGSIRSWKISVNHVLITRIRDCFFPFHFLRKKHSQTIKKFIVGSLKLHLFLAKFLAISLPNPVHQYFYSNKYLSYQVEQL